MNTPEPCDKCCFLYVNAMQKDNPSYMAECTKGLRMGNKNCVEFKKIRKQESKKKMKKRHSRPSWDDYFMQIAQVVASRSTCLRRRVGAVIVKDKRIISTGYNGAPSGLTHCADRPEGCLRNAQNIPSDERHEICLALHAEQNAIIQAALHGVSTKNSTIYVTIKPCVICTKMIINAGIKSVFFHGNYPDKMSEPLLKEAGILWAALRS